MKDKETSLLSLRVAPKTASKFKVEAARRGMRQNQLFEEMAVAYFEKAESTKPKRGAKNG